MKKVSIIILTHNNLRYTTQCIDSIFKYSYYKNMELVIVDNNSKDGTRRYLKQLRSKHNNIKLIFNDTNKGFAKGNNQGIRASSGYYIILLNNDTIVTKNWINNLIKYLDDPLIGIVGPVSNQTASIAKIKLEFKSLKEMHRQAEKYTVLNSDHSFKVGWLSFFCVAVRRETIKKVGLLDEKFQLGRFEDIDYCKRITDKGYKILCADDIFVYHKSHASFNKLSSEYLNKITIENKKYFEKKWRTKWSTIFNSIHYIDLLQKEVEIMFKTLSKNQKTKKENPEFFGFCLRLVARLKVLNTTIKDENKYLHDIYNSISWRMTKPLRYVKKLLK